MASVENLKLSIFESGEPKNNLKYFVFLLWVYVHKSLFSSTWIA